MKKFFKQLLGKEVIAALWHRPKAVLAALAYGFPARSCTVIVVAGSKGKTSTAYFTSHLLDTAGIKNALFCTAAQKIDGAETLNTLKLTTATPFFFQRFLRRAVTAGCSHVIVEVSSHALVQERLWSVPFHIVVLTNLSPDHLEYHRDAGEYQRTHERLITPRMRTLILNGDDKNLNPFAALPVTKIIARSGDDAASDIASLVRLPGDFQLANARLAATVARALSIPDAIIEQGLSSLTGAPGRMEEIPNDRGICILVDYAHSVQSLNTFFASIKSSVSGRLIAVFGACGERDSSQRPLMGTILDEYADGVIITNDDPYSEDPQTIADQVKQGITRKKEGETLLTILDRRSAIKQALFIAQHGDTVCVLGKGAEQWQVFADKKIPWDDRKVIQEILNDVIARQS